jgi:hypothetical protein
MGFEVLTAVVLKTTVAQDVMSWYMIMNVSKVPALTIFYPEDG